MSTLIFQNDGDIFPTDKGVWLMENLDHHDKAAIAVLLRRTVRAWSLRTEAEADRADAQSRLEDADKAISLTRSAFSAFGFDPAASTLWLDVRSAIGDEAYDAAVDSKNSESASSEESKTSLVSDANPELIEGKVYDKDVSISEIVIDQLKMAGSSGTTALSIQKFVEEVHKRSIHDKTIGMTLYRLSQRGTSRREGRKWFFVSSSIEAKDPGGNAPGPDNALD